jgi:hypothetical protein
MAQKNKITFTVRIDEELFKKMLVTAENEGRDINNHILHLIRTNVSYEERIHGKIDVSKVELPDDIQEQ